jgi:isopentenyl-diphosphate Delta-isomerase
LREAVKVKSEDIFDVVDENDEVVGQEKRSIVHRKGLRHRAVHILIFNAKGELFLQKRSKTKDVAPGLWDSSACGHVDSGETYDVAAIRELGEELGVNGISAKQLEHLFKVEAREETGQEFVEVYRLRHEGPFDLHPEEIESGRWYTLEAVNRLISEKPDTAAASFRFIWSRL